MRVKHLLVILAVGVLIGCIGVAVILAHSTAPGQQPAAPVPPTAPAAPTQPAPATPNLPACGVIHDYALVSDMIEVATHQEPDYWLHVEYFTADGQPEYETLLEGGRYKLNRPLRGHVWEYRGCSAEDVMEQINAHIARRVAEKANNAGFVNWQSTGLFTPMR